MSGKAKIPKDWKPWVKMAIPDGSTRDVVDAAVRAHPGRGNAYVRLVGMVDLIAWEMRKRNWLNVHWCMRRYAELYAECPASWKAKK